MKKLVATAAVFGLVGVAAADFSGPYDPGNWNFYADDDGYVQTGNAPAQIELFGTNSGTWYSYTTLTIMTPAAGSFDFDWNYGSFDSPATTRSATSSTGPTTSSTMALAPALEV